MAHPPGQHHDKAARYDRQLRLWGEDGQARVEAARVLLLNANATGAETLKNLVLPGIGSFTIVDGKKVEAADLGNNFFITADSVGQPRARIVTELLKELNEFVHGNFIEEDPVHLIDSKPSFVLEYTHVVASSLPEASLRKLAQTCWEHSIPLITVRSYGLLGYLRIAVEEHRVVESKRENIAEDLRLFNPFPELSTFANSFDYTKMTDPQYSHVPYAVILMQALHKWRAAHDGKAPSTSAEKTQFREGVKKSARSFGQENIEEAVKAAPRYCWQAAPLRPEVRALLADPKVGQVTDTTPSFWILATALRDFVANEGQGSLPQAGTVPDMHSDTESFIALQKLFQEKANKDLAVMVSRVGALLAKTPKHSAIHEDEVKAFCRNAQYLQVLRFTSLESELANKNASALANYKQELEQPNSYVAWYLLLRSVDRFVSTNGRFPGAFDDEVEADVGKLKTFVTTLTGELGIDAAKVSDDQIHEICRCGGAELHTIASVMGAVAAQEVIKLVTHKWVPLNNSFFYNGMTSVASRYEA